MTRNKIMTVAMISLALGGTGAVIATAQSAPETPDAPPAEAQAVPLEVHGGPGRDHGEGRGMRRHGGHSGLPGHHGDSGMGRGGGMFRTVFDTVDADGDGSVTRLEIDDYLGKRVAEVDSSGDGALAIEEFDTLYRDVTRSRMVDMFQDLDADGDGLITEAEMDTRIARLVDRMDRDGDGALTRPGACGRGAGPAVGTED